MVPPGQACGRLEGERAARTGTVQNAPEQADNKERQARMLLETLIPLLLYADDLILMSTTASGLQKQLDVLASFCETHQLTVNLTKTKVVIFEPRRTDCIDLVFAGKQWFERTTTGILGFTSMQQKHGIRCGSSCCCCQKGCSCNAQALRRYLHLGPSSAVQALELCQRSLGCGSQHWGRR